MAKNIIGEKLKLLIAEKGIQQKDLANFLQTTPQNISRYVKGEREPNIETLKQLAEYFNVTLDYLSGRSNIKTQDPLHEIIINTLKEYGMIDDLDNISRIDLEKFNKVLQKILDLYETFKNS